jgi:hypothetical protein
VRQVPLFEALRGFLGIGIFIGGCGLLMVFMQPAGSAEYVASVCSAAIGGVLVLAVVVTMVLMRSRDAE